MPVPNASTGHLAENVMHFTRVLRAAGLPIGPDRVIDAVRALDVGGIGRRDDFYWTLASVLIDRREQFELFDQAFQMFWRDPRMLERAMMLTLAPPEEAMGQQEKGPSNRLSEAMPQALRPKESQQGQEEQKVEVDATYSFSA
ncbi:MAG: VWA domain-containing protein, partial [Betaproteobacteria bacterium]|nr:VWA domain-containing protein [Betaproteobacteria bacterium]